MFTIFLTNFGWYTQWSGADLESAKTEARRVGFESQIVQGGRTVLVYSPIGGFRGIA
jgi:hypothetical protein